jgi:DNA helicase-2/ATP-dependent DNA helicase PcrA
MTWSDSLVGSALDIAGSDEPVIRVMAGPGTGKSFAMKRRAMRLVEQGQIGSRILAVTFTNNAAKSLRDDLESVGETGSTPIHVATLHSLCLSILNQENALSAVGRKTRFLLKYELRYLVKDLAHEGHFGSATACVERLHAFEAAWARLNSEEPGWPLDPIDRRFSSTILAWLRFHKCMLLGELVPETVRYLKANPSSAFRNAYDHVIVDEYQDLNRAEQALVDLIKGVGSLAVVGDENQSIFGFRFAHPEGIRDFHQNHETTFDIPLEECRRCPANIVSMANSLILNNHPSSTVPILRPLDSSSSGRVEIVKWDTLEAEIQGVSHIVESLIDQEGYLPREIMVLSPRKSIGIGIKDLLKAKQVPVHSYFEEEFLTSILAQESLTLLSLMVNKRDAVSLRVWIGLGAVNGSVGSYQTVKYYCELYGLSLFDCLEGLIDGSLTISRVSPIIGRYSELNRRLESLQNRTVSQIIDELFPVGNLDIAPLRELALEMLPQVSNNEEFFKLFVNELLIPSSPTDGNFVRVMSLQKSKGLTSRVTIVTSCVAGIIPDDADIATALGREEIREQRRLFYVAITRSTEVLFLSLFKFIDYAAAQKLRVNVTGVSRTQGRTQPSRFITELGTEMPLPISGGSMHFSEHE